MLCENCTQLFARSIVWEKKREWLDSSQQELIELLNTRHIDSVVAKGTHQLSVAALRASAAASCYLCTTVLAELYRSRFRTSEPLDLSPFTKFTLYAGGKARLRIELCNQKIENIQPISFDLLPVSHERESFPQDEQSATTRTSAPEVLQLARRWLNECLDSHEDCTENNGNWFPPRLLDVGNMSNSPPRLILTDKEKPEGNYATLSHCWGPNPIFYMLTDATMDQMLKEVPMFELAQNFRDAIYVAHKLNFRYIWIDSLCILQKGERSESDWSTHAAIMKTIYRKATLTISADRALDTNSGLFADRDPRVVSPTTVSLPVPPDGWAHSPSYQILCSFGQNSAEHYYELLSHMPLASRAWAFQERVLSSRILHFGTEQIHWECIECQLRCEVVPDMQIAQLGYASDFFIRNEAKSSSDAPNDDKVDPLTTSEWARWSRALAHYTSCALTFPTKDKLVAFAGIAEWLRPTKSHDDSYVAGIWSATLPRALLWQVNHPLNSKRAGAYRAPSWSWASIDGPVDHGYASGNYTTLETASLLAEVEGFSVDLVNEDDSYGQVRNAEIILSGFVIELKAVERRLVRTRAGIAAAWAAVDLTADKTEYWDLYFDDNDDDFQVEMSYVVPDRLCLLIIDTVVWAQLSGLILSAVEEPVSNMSSLPLKTYTRRGVFRCAERYAEVLLKGTKSSIRII